MLFDLGTFLRTRLVAFPLLAIAQRAAKSFHHPIMDPLVARRADRRGRRASQLRLSMSVAGPKANCPDVRYAAAIWVKADSVRTSQSRRVNAPEPTTADFGIPHGFEPSDNAGFAVQNDIGNAFSTRGYHAQTPYSLIR